jgi:hypothetical protein
MERRFYIIAARLSALGVQRDGSNLFWAVAKLNLLRRSIDVRNTREFRVLD